MRVVVGITGATGAIFGIRILQALRELAVNTEVIISKWARVTIQHETDFTAPEVEALATEVHSNSNLAASISSGSFKTDGMIIAPCSMKSLAAVRSGYAADLIGRAADVMLKERRKLVLLPRESPLNDIHLENMLALSRMGAVMIPPVPSFYDHPKNLGEMINHIVARVLDQFGLEMPNAARWDGLRKSDAGSSDEHLEVAPDVFSAETPCGTHQGMTDQVVMSRTPGSFRTVLVPRGSSKSDWLEA